MWRTQPWGGHWKGQGVQHRRSQRSTGWVGAVFSCYLLAVQNSPLATWSEDLIHWKKSRCRERLRAGGEGDNRGQDGPMALPTQWTWVWASPGRWWRTEEPGYWSPQGLKESDITQRLNRNNNTCYGKLSRTLFRILCPSLSIQLHEGASLRQRRACCDHVSRDPLTCS